MILASALIVGAAVIGAAFLIATALRECRSSDRRARTLDLVAMFAPAVNAAEHDARTLLAWHPLAQTARGLFPEEFADIEAAAGAAFPFGRKQFEAAHARWTAEWLAWELAHDSTYKLKAAEAQHDLAASGGSPVVRSRLDAIEREKLDLYQRRYEEYVRVAKALQALVDSSPEVRPAGR